MKPLLPVRRPSSKPRLSPRPGRLPRPGSLAKSRLSSKQRRRQRRQRRRRVVLLLVCLIAVMGMSRGLWWPIPEPPQLILVLGGDLDRERHAAALARSRGLPVVVSGGSNPEYAQWLFEQSQGLPPGQVRLDYRATDTLSNFTSLVDDLQRAGIGHALLVTSRDHMERALLVGRIVAGSRGIRLTPESVDCAELCRDERRRKIWGDGLRALWWVISGRDLRQSMDERLDLGRW